MKFSSVFLAMMAATLLADGESFRIYNKTLPRSNWQLVRSRLNDFDVFTYMSYTFVNDAFHADNEELYEEVWPILMASLEEAWNLTNLVSDEITAETLTVEIAKVHFGEILVIFTDLYADLRDSMEQLTEPARIAVSDHFAAFFMTAPQYAQNIYAALEEPAPESCGLTGLNSNNTVIPPEPVDAWTPPGTAIWNGETFSVAETFLMMHAHNKFLDQEVTTGSRGQLTLLTSSDFPNFTDETGMENISRTIMFRCTDSSTVTYKFEIPVNSDPIVEPTVKPMF